MCMSVCGVWVCAHAHVQAYMGVMCMESMCVHTGLCVGTGDGGQPWVLISFHLVCDKVSCLQLHAIGELAIKLGRLWSLSPISPQDSWVTDTCATQPGSSCILRIQTQSLLLAW